MKKTMPVAMAALMFGSTILTSAAAATAPAAPAHKKPNLAVSHTANPNCPAPIHVNLKAHCQPHHRKCVPVKPVHFVCPATPAASPTVIVLNPPPTEVVDRGEVCPMRRPGETDQDYVAHARTYCETRWVSLSKHDGIGGRRHDDFLAQCSSICGAAWTPTPAPPPAAATATAVAKGGASDFGVIAAGLLVAGGIGAIAAQLPHDHNPISP